MTGAEETLLTCDNAECGQTWTGGLGRCPHCKKGHDPNDPYRQPSLQEPEYVNLAHLHGVITCQMPKTVVVDEAVARAAVVDAVDKAWEIGVRDERARIVQIIETEICDADECQTARCRTLRGIVRDIKEPQNG